MTCFVVENIPIKGVTFVDDILDFMRSSLDVMCRLVSDEVFEKENRLKFKPTKCKVMYNGNTGDLVFTLDEVELDLVDEHVYLGTIVEMFGRNKDVAKRIKDAQGVVNEIVLICKTPELATYRLQFVNILVQSCLCMKVKYGSEMWDDLSKKQRKEVDELKVKTVKRVMEVSHSTPSIAIQCEFGLMDMSLEIALGKVLFTLKILKSCEDRVARRLLKAMLSKSVPGYCSHVRSICREIFGTTVEELLSYDGDVKDWLKKAAYKVQEERLVLQMLKSSKTNAILLHSFQFDGKRKAYLNFPFQEAKIIFQLRTRMFLTKDNFPGRWIGKNCNICGRFDTDQHLFTCSGYKDLLGGLKYQMFVDLTASDELLREGATQLIKVNERLKIIQEAGCRVDDEGNES